MNCSACGHENPDHARFCIESGAGFPLACASCGIELPGAAKFCLGCGTRVATASPALRGASQPEDPYPNVEPERSLKALAPARLTAVSGVQVSLTRRICEPLRISQTIAAFSFRQRTFCSIGASRAAGTWSGNKI